MPAECCFLEGLSRLHSHEQWTKSFLWCAFSGVWFHPCLNCEPSGRYMMIFCSWLTLCFWWQKMQTVVYMLTFRWHITLNEASADFSGLLLIGLFSDCWVSRALCIFWIYKDSPKTATRPGYMHPCVGGEGRKKSLRLNQFNKVDCSMKVYRIRNILQRWQGSPFSRRKDKKCHTEITWMGDSCAAHREA